MEDDLKQGCIEPIDDAFFENSEGPTWYPFWRYCPICGSELPRSYWLPFGVEGLEEAWGEFLTEIVDDPEDREIYRKAFDNILREIEPKESK
jgi:hypothetical protein